MGKVGCDIWEKWVGGAKKNTSKVEPVGEHLSHVRLPRRDIRMDPRLEKRIQKRMNL